MAQPGCELCWQLHGLVIRSALQVTIPMCGERPTYWLCEEHLADVSAFVEGRAAEGER